MKLKKPSKEKAFGLCVYRNDSKIGQGCIQVLKIQIDLIHLHSNVKREIHKRWTFEWLKWALFGSIKTKLIQGFIRIFQATCPWNSKLSVFSLLFFFLYYMDMVWGQADTYQWIAFKSKGHKAIGNSTTHFFFLIISGKFTSLFFFSMKSEYELCKEKKKKLSYLHISAGNFEVFPWNKRKICIYFAALLSFSS